MHSNISSSPSAQRLANAIEGLFGGQVPHRAGAQAQCMHRLERPDCALEQWQIRPEDCPGLTWTLCVQWPRHDLPCAVLLSPDGCWPHCVGEAASRAVNGEQVALAWFNRTELAFDPPHGQCQGPVFERWPTLGFGAIAAWAWGLQCCTDVLLQMPGADARRLGVIGHSRGGKAALLAGASDARIAATVAHNSGTAGAASLLRSGAGAETLAELLAHYPHWLARHGISPSRMQALVEVDAPTLLMSSLAPRGLCLLQARDDAWANPAGTRHAFERLQPLWQAQQASHRLVLHEREGGHAMTLEDWQRAARFVRALT